MFCALKRARFGRAFLRSALVAGVLTGGAALAAPAEFLGPAPYLSVADRPFATNGFDYFFLEDLEDGMANLPGALVNTGWVVNVPGPDTDSVDADDGAINGSGTGGHSAYSDLTQSNLTVTFDPGVFGDSMPTHAGLVCTDIGGVLSGIVGFGDPTFSATDTNGVLLGSITLTNFGNGSAVGDSPGATEEDRFFGVIYPDGLGSISLTVHNSLDWEVDHVQFGRLDPAVVVPELRIETAGPDAVQLLWTTNAVGYQLQQTPGWSPANWSPVTGTPVIVGPDYQVTVTPLGSRRYYRLRAD